MTKELILNSRKKSIIDGAVATKLPIIIKCKDEKRTEQLLTYISESYGLRYFDLAMSRRFGNSKLLNSFVDSQCVINNKALEETDQALLGDHVQLYAYIIGNSDEFHLHLKLIEKPLFKLNLTDSFPHKIINGDINGNYDVFINNSKDYLNLKVHNDRTIEVMNEIHEARLTEAYFQGVNHYTNFNAEPLLITVDPTSMKQKNIVKNIRSILQDQILTGIHCVIENTEKLSFGIESELVRIMGEVEHGNGIVGGKQNDSI